MADISHKQISKTCVIVDMMTFYLKESPGSALSNSQWLSYSFKFSDRRIMLLSNMTSCGFLVFFCFVLITLIEEKKQRQECE